MLRSGRAIFSCFKPFNGNIVNVFFLLYFRDIVLFCEENSLFLSEVGLVIRSSCITVNMPIQLSSSSIASQVFLKSQCFVPWVYCKSSSHANIFLFQHKSFLLKHTVSVERRGQKKERRLCLRCDLPTDYRSTAASLRIYFFSHFFPHRS